jgi:lysophospholipase L1-like esterase
VFLSFRVAASPDSLRIRQILILGDSHLNGDFGEYLQKRLHAMARYDILSIAIGGSGSRHFVLPMTNFCCGYKIRETCYGEIIPDRERIRTIEKNTAYSGEVVAKAFRGRLSRVLSHYSPDIVILALGSNNTNAHQELVSIIRKYSSSCPIIWIGPFNRSKVQDRIRLILETIRRNPDMYYVKSEDILGHDTLTSGHFYGKSAMKWAQTVTERMKPLLQKM